MSAALTSSEWERLELLLRCASQLRQGTPISQEVLSQLQQLQNSVQAERATGHFQKALGLPELSSLESDLFVAALAPEIEPRIGWLYQQLQNGQTQPYPTLALLQEVFAIPPAEMPEMYAALQDGSQLRPLLELEDSHLFSPIRPARGLSSKLMGVSTALVAPPGSVHITSKVTWSDLVLPDAKLSRLREFLHWIHHRETVVEKWGGRALGGPLALFSGPSGTGKTLAASVIANELGWPLYRVDIGALVSKYIGETEKNINRLFAAAHQKPMVLQFDEADSLFGKRGEIKEARDRYANLEVSHLLARIEQHDGPVILTTNLQSNLDAAFSRRFQVVIEFSRPSTSARAQMWSIHLPPRAPRTKEVDIDLIGQAFELTGGEIRNAALHAAYLAAAGRQIIGLEEIVLAVYRELGKSGRAPSIEELGTFASYLPEELQ